MPNLIYVIIRKKSNSVKFLDTFFVNKKKGRKKFRPYIYKKYICKYFVGLFLSIFWLFSITFFTSVTSFPCVTFPLYLCSLLHTPYSQNSYQSHHDPCNQWHRRRTYLNNMFRRTCCICFYFFCHWTRIYHYSTWKQASMSHTSSNRL